MPSEWSVEGFMDNVKEYIVEMNKEDEVDFQSSTTIRNSFLLSNQFVGMTESTCQTNVLRKITTKQSHKEHMDRHSCHSLGQIIKDRLFHFNNKCSKVRINKISSLNNTITLKHAI